MGCCGHPAKTKKKRIIKEKLPPNPQIQSGIKLIYLGHGRLAIKGRKSGLKYYVSDHRRYFAVHRNDVDQILKNRDFILKP